MKYKIKINSSLKKRFFHTNSGLIKYKKSNLNHILTKKSSKKKRILRKHSILSKPNLYMINKCFLKKKNKNIRNDKKKM